MEWIIELGKLLIISWVLTDLINFIGETISLYGPPRNKVLGTIYLMITYMMVCNKCNSFWLTLIMTGSLLEASIIATLINYGKQIEYKYKRTEL